MKNDRGQLSFLEEIIVDNFAGGGGASTGIELATGRPVTIAVNHDPDAILMHRTNHPFTEHYQASVWDVDPREVSKGRPVGLAWFSPDCKHFSKAKGAKPVDRNIRGLAWIVLRWAGTVAPRVIMLENVEEFQTWGPVRKGRPVKAKAGRTFRRWLSQLEALGYAVEWRELVAADYGAPTTRKRFFLVARRDGRPIVWPEPTHAPAGSPEVKAGKKLPWRSAAEIIDWHLPCPSIFETREAIREQYGLSAQRPLRPNTLRRVAGGVDKFVIRAAAPFLVPMDSAVCPEPARVGDGKHVLGASLIQYHTEQAEKVRGQKVTGPLMTIDAANRYGLTAASLIKYYGSDRCGQSIRPPLHTVTVKDREGLTTAHLVKMKGTNLGGPATEPVQTITAGGGHHGVVSTRITRAETGADLRHWPEIRALLNAHCGYDLGPEEVLLLRHGGAWYFLADIGLRMLTPRELYRASGFPEDYKIEQDCTGKRYGKSKQVARCGNAVPPPFAAALVRANLPEWCTGIQITTMAELEQTMAV